MNSALLAKDLHLCVDLSTSKILWNSELHIIKGVTPREKSREEIIAEAEAAAFAEAEASDS